MWTTEVGRGRVFVSGVGHNYFTFNDPYFRIILLRAMAWTMNESFDPFKPLVRPISNGRDGVQCSLDR